MPRPPGLDLGRSSMRHRHRQRPSGDRKCRDGGPPAQWGGEYVDVGAVRAGNIATGRCPDDRLAFYNEIVEALLEMKPRR